MLASAPAADSNAAALVGLVGPQSSDAERPTPRAGAAPAAGELAAAAVWTIGPCAHGGSSWRGLGEQKSGFVKVLLYPEEGGEKSQFTGETGLGA